MQKKDEEEIVRIIKYIFSAGSSFVIDVALFTVFKLLLTNTLTIGDTIIIFIATTLARIISSIYNYLINSRIVFKNKHKNTIIGYFILVIVQMIASASFVSIFDKLLKINTSIIKICVDIIIFIVNYIVQKEIIFKKRDDKSEKHI